ncbi:MAG: hypothetical protein HZA17_03210 [Nitrospirae bacterium]|nr:hypothetical protein [Nitrospirota bacterium]
MFHQPMKSSLSAILVLFFAFMFQLHPAGSAEKEKEKEKKPPVTLYWMDVSTQNQSIPGMSEEMSSGMGGFMGKMMGGPGFGPSRSIFLHLNSPQALPKEPAAAHDIPPGQKMGDTLPLLIPVQEKIKPEKYEETEKTPMEKPKMRMLIYWGCGETIGKNQPRVLDTEKMSMMDFGKAMTPKHVPSVQYPPRPRSGWIYADWPNRKDSTQVPKDSSLLGSHLVHGNYMPEIKFSIDQMHDFMAPVEFTSVTGGLGDSIKFQWKAVPTATGYFAMAIGHREKTGETIFWSSSEVPDTGFGLMDYLPTSDVRRFIKEKVVMDPKVTSCNIPKGVFKVAEGGMIQFIAYGDEMNVVHPPKPKDPKAVWNPIWSVKLRLKSTGMVPLGMEGEQKDPRSRSKKKAVRDEDSEESQKQAEEKEKPEEKPEESGSPLKKLRKGLFGF